jgi:hypothetical protein
MRETENMRVWEEEKKGKQVKKTCKPLREGSTEGKGMEDKYEEKRGRIYRGKACLILLQSSFLRPVLLLLLLLLLLLVSLLSFVSFCV